MNILLFFILPLSTILLSIVLQKILKCPILVAITFFAIYLIVTYTAITSNFFIYTIVYTILAYVTAVLTRLICLIKRKFRECNFDERLFNLFCRDNCNRNNNIESCNNIASFSNGNNIIGTNNTTNGNAIGTNNFTDTANNSGRNTGCCNNSCNNAQASFTVTSNQANPVLLLTNRTNMQRRSNCNCCRRCN